MSEEHKYEEEKTVSDLAAWILLSLLSLALLGYGMWLMFTIPDVPRKWNYAALPDTPAQSAYSTMEPSPVTTEKKIISPLPEGRPLDKKQQEQEEQKQREENVEERSGSGIKLF